MFRALPWLFLVACATAEPGEPEPTIPTADLFEKVWAETIRPNDILIGVPGTGAYSTLGRYIEEAIDPADPTTIFEGRSRIADVQVLEGAIESAHRAGISDAQLEAGDITIAIWGAGITEFDEFRYRSVGGLDLVVGVVGGRSVCADGGIFDNITNYNRDNAAKDAGDLYRRTKSWLQAIDSTADRNVILVAHSWGGVVAEYVTASFASFAVGNGEWDGTLAFTVAGGVPGMVPGFATFSPGFRTVTSEAGARVSNVPTYEVARPDDPIRTFDPNSQGGGHNYIIVVGEEYLGWYGITTDELACAGEPGACPPRT